MNISKPIYAAAAAALCSLSANSQALSGEVTVERTITPVERPASRLGSVAPTIFTPQIKLKPLEAAAYNGTGQLSRSLTRLEPAAYADTFAIDPWRGYASFGYLPNFNMGIAAGYDLIASRTTRLGVMLNYSGLQYKADDSGVTEPERVTVASHAFTIGTNLATYVAPGKRIDADAAYTFSSVKNPWRDQTLDGGANHARIALGFSSAGETLPWNAGVSYSYFGFRHDTPADVLCVDPILQPFSGDITPASESILGLKGAVTWHQDNHWWQLGIESDIQWLNQLARVWPFAAERYAEPGDPSEPAYNAVPVFWDEGAHTLSTTSLTPSYNINRTAFALRLGAKVQFTTGPRGNKFRIAPDVDFTWTPSGRFALDVRLTGGEQLNSLAELNAGTPWLIPAFSYERSNVPVAIDAAATFGPFSGISIRPFFGFALADSWLMPGVVAGRDLNQYQYQDVHGVHYGLEVSYALRKILKASVSAEGASSSDDDAENAYYLWRDRAKWQIKAAVEVHPIKPLTVGLSYTLRTDRKAFMLQPECLADMPLAWYRSDESLDLGNINDLQLNASWRFNPQLSVFLQLDNLLCRRYQILYGVPSARMGGLLGLNFKF